MSKYLEMYMLNEDINIDNIDINSLSVEDKYYINCILAKKYFDSNFKIALNCYENINLINQLIDSSIKINNKLENKDVKLNQYSTINELVEFDYKEKIENKIIKESKKGNRNLLYYIVSTLFIIIFALAIEMYLHVSRFYYIFVGAIILFLDIFVVPRLEEIRENEAIKKMYQKDDSFNKIDYMMANENEIASYIKFRYSNLL